MKTIYTIACNLPGGYGEHVGFNSKASLLDADQILFVPRFRYYDNYETHQGKQLLSNTSSFKLQDSIRHWRKEIGDVLKAGRNVFMIMSELQEVLVSTGETEFSGTGRDRVETRHVAPLRNYDVIPFQLQIFESRGRSMILHPREQILGNYWQNFGDVSAYQVYIGESKNVKRLVQTRYGGRTVGAILPTKSGGALVMLPWVDFDQDDFFAEVSFNEDGAAEIPEDMDADEYWEEEWTSKAKEWGRRYLSELLSLDETLRKRGETTPAPHWVSADRFRTCQEALLSDRLLQMQSEIAELEEKRKTIEADLIDAGNLKGLLFEQGRALEQAVLDSMRLMGFEANSYRDSDSEFDVVLECIEGRCVGEVEGKNKKAIGIDKMRQLESNIQEDFAREEVSVHAKGILFGNAYRLIPPSDRPDEHFTAKCLTAARRNGIALIRTCELFEVARALADTHSEQFAAQCREAILNTCGQEVKFPTIPEIELSTTRIEKSLDP